jgi:hypothetical protein
LIVCGTDDVYLPLKLSHWLAQNIAGTRRRAELKNAGIFSPEQRWGEFDKELRAHWLLVEEQALHRELSATHCVLLSGIVCRPTAQ